MDLSKIFTRAAQPRLQPERVSVPGVTDEDREQARALRAAGAIRLQERRDFLLAMMRTGRPIAARPVPARKRRKPTKNERHMARRKVRVAFLAEAVS